MAYPSARPTTGPLPASLMMNGDPRPAGGPLATNAPIAQLPVGSTAPGSLMNAPPQAPGQPLATVPHTVIPQIAPYTAPAPLGPPPGTIQTGQFTAPDANNFTKDPSFQWRLSQGLKAIQGSAAAHGTLLNTDTVRSLSDYAGGAASQEYGNAYNRALQSYNTNRDTNQVNFGQNQTVFGDTLPIYDRKVAAAQTAQQQQQAQMDRDAAAQNQNAAEYAQMVEAQRASSMPALSSRPPMGAAGPAGAAPRGRWGAGFDPYTLNYGYRGIPGLSLGAS